MATRFFGKSFLCSSQNMLMFSLHIQKNNKGKADIFSLKLEISLTLIRRKNDIMHLFNIFNQVSLMETLLENKNSPSGARKPHAIEIWNSCNKVNSWNWNILISRYCASVNSGTNKFYLHSPHQSWVPTYDKLGSSMA